MEQLLQNWMALLEEVSLAVIEEVNLPIRFIGAGEGIADLRPFNSFEFIEAMLIDK